jgi:hypothetical protein
MDELLTDIDRHKRHALACKLITAHNVYIIVELTLFLIVIKRLSMFREWATISTFLPEGNDIDTS